MQAQANALQIADWNGQIGERWASQRREIEGIVAPFGLAGLQAAAAATGERVLDVGCGCGDSSIALAHRVGAPGAVLGVDVSQPMLEIARAAAARQRLPQLAFAQADASAAELPRQIDLLFSRFGIMFFDRPAAALAHLRAALRGGGRAVFVCWRAPRDNPWAMAPVSAARAALGITPPPADPDAPGPFAFADGERLRALLAEAGFGAVELRRFDAPVTLGPTPRLAAETALRIGPVSRLAAEVGEDRHATIVDAVERALAPFAAAGGAVRLAGSAWIVCASSHWRAG